MRLILTAIVLLAFIFSSSALAVNKTGTKKLKKEKPDSVLKLKTDKLQPSSGTKQSATDKRKDYNDFIDKNNNGLDDRIESRKKKAADTQSSDKKKADKKKKASPAPEKKTKKK